MEFNADEYSPDCTTRKQAAPAEVASHSTSGGVSSIAVGDNAVVAGARHSLAGTEQSMDTQGGFLLGEVLFAELGAGYGRYDYSNRDVGIGDEEITVGSTIWATFGQRPRCDSRSNPNS
jgi:hypothetical protein